MKLSELKIGYTGWSQKLKRKSDPGSYEIFYNSEVETYVFWWNVDGDYTVFFKTSDILELSVCLLDYIEAPEE